MAHSWDQSFLYDQIRWRLTPMGPRLYCQHCLLRNSGRWDLPPDTYYIALLDTSIDDGVVRSGKDIREVYYQLIPLIMVYDSHKACSSILISRFA
jgi:hypothetical protein